MTANIAFSLCAAAASLLVAVLAGFKGDWAVSAVWAALAVGFVARARYGIARRRAEQEPADPPPRPPRRRVQGARFRRR